MKTLTRTETMGQAAILRAAGWTLKGSYDRHDVYSNPAFACRYYVGARSVRRGRSFARSVPVRLRLKPAGEKYLPNMKAEDEGGVSGNS